MIRRGRLLTVVAVLAAGALGVVSSTQTWLTVTLRDGGGETLAVPGADAIPVLAPLSLAVLALGGALSVVGVVLRFVFAALTIAVAVLLGVLTTVVATVRPVDAVASTVTDATGISGAPAVADLVETVAITPWPVAALAGWVLLVAAGLIGLATAARWRSTGARFRAAGAGEQAPAEAPSAPRDAIDSWDDLSRGDDPTTR